jgi:hypothetical protein
MYKEVFRLAMLLACISLATSRLGLIAHELVGHGGTALAMSGHITEVRLFWFAGGWIRFELSSPSTVADLAISLGGIAVELLAGTVIWVLARRDTLAMRISRGVAAALIVHAGLYLSTGTWDGHGDGAQLYAALGSARYVVAITAGVVTCVAAFAGARIVLGALAETLPRHRIAGTLVALGLAGGLNAGLALGEIRLRRDDVVYTTIMQSERDRIVALELAKWLAAHPDVQPETRAHEQLRIQEEHKTFPFAWLLRAAVIAAGIAGILRAKPGTGEVLTRRLLAIAGALAAISIFTVIAIDLVAGR